MLTPFPLPTEHRHRLGTLPSCGFWKLDVRANGKWDGVVAVAPDFSVSGVYIRGKVETFDLPFTPDEIEAVRGELIWNRSFSRYPDVFLFGFPYSSILLIAPGLIVLGILSHWAFFLAGIAILVGAVLVIGYAGRTGGYCLTGGPFILAALLQFVFTLFRLWAFS